MPYKIGVVGGSGFIGNALSNFIQKIYDIKIIDINPIADFNISHEYSQCDIRNYVELERSLKDVDLVIHTAIIQIPLINGKGII